MELDGCTRCQECTRQCPVHAASRNDPATDPMARLTRWKECLQRQHGIIWPLAAPLLKEDCNIQPVVTSSSLCATCGQCQEVCEAGISLVPLWESMRANLACQGISLPSPLDTLPGLVGRYGNPYGEPESRQAKWVPDGAAILKKAPLGYFPGCTVMYRQPETAVAAIRILNTLGEDFCIPRGRATCCGSVLFRTGAVPSTEELVRDQVRAIEEAGVKTLLFTCAGCFKTVSVDWPRVIHGPLPFRPVSFSEYLWEQVRENRLKFKREVPLTITYHDPCHSGRHLKGLFGAGRVFEAPRNVLRSIPGLTLVEMEKNRELQVCCGAGGGLKMVSPGLALSCGTRKINDVRATGATEIATTCPFCRRNIDEAAKVDTTGCTPIVIRDITSLVAEAMDLFPCEQG